MPDPFLVADFYLVGDSFFFFVTFFLPLFSFMDGILSGKWVFLVLAALTNDESRDGICEL